MIVLKQMQILKIKGKAKIPDYIQLRDENYTLIAYFRADRPEKALIKCGLGDEIDRVKKIIDDLPFGVLTDIEF